MDKAVGRNMRIAALDDDALQLDLFKQALHAMGHTCHTYLTGAQLLHSLQSECFDLLIVDWHLPDTTGPEVVRWVRQHVGLEMPILFVTHRQEERDIVEGLGCGADDFMTKPVRIGELRARVAALLRRSYTDKPEEVLEFGRYRFLPESRSLEIDGAPVELKNREYELALFLFQNMGAVAHAGSFEGSDLGPGAGCDVPLAGHPHLPPAYSAGSAPRQWFHRDLGVRRGLPV